MRWLLLSASLLVASVACSPETLEPLPLEASIQASRTTAAPGDTVTFVVNAQGGVLVGMEIDYGDSSAEQYGTGGARTAKVTFRHAYLQRGMFTVRVVVTDAVAGGKEASIAVQVN